MKTKGKGKKRVISLDVRWQHKAVVREAISFESKATKLNLFVIYNCTNFVLNK